MGRKDNGSVNRPYYGVALAAWAIGLAVVMLISDFPLKFWALFALAVASLVPTLMCAMVWAKLTEEQEARSRANRDFLVLGNYLRKFIPLNTLQEGTDNRLRLLATSCARSQSKLKRFMESGFSAVGRTQNEGESDGEYIRNAETMRRALESEHQRNVQEFDSAYEHAEEVRRSTGVSLRGKDFELYSMQENQAAA